MKNRIETSSDSLVSALFSDIPGVTVINKTEVASKDIKPSIIHRQMSLSSIVPGVSSIPTKNQINQYFNKRQEETTPIEPKDSPVLKLVK